ncbi:putative membrane protein [Enterococcus sp. PF1-24]|uniref:DUF1700 domain-containing protein n=1 Tax=unclassified Enterococcus TaxID=2608891 RepID=UPI00247435FA|nr:MULTISPECIES: DUF1700 domain-containing protein [unclassified Enterococcus]MDH6364624.1 putative membrane protein [Enterococcus sp. PFB1-1]MDH6401725.1 putative membrane protein [Enterococcus sp. PF1-24]
MDRIDFIKALADELAYEVKPSEIHQLINYYDEIIQDLMEDGYSEKEAVAKLGSPKKLAKEAAGIQEVEIDIPRRMSTWVLVLLVIGFPIWGSLLIAFVAVIASFYLVLWCIPFSTGLTGVVCTICGAAAAVLSPLLMADTLYLGTMQLGAGAAFFGIGILLLILTFSISGSFLRITKKTFAGLKHAFFKPRKQVVRL